MTFSDSMFLVELMVEDLKSLVACKEFVIKSQFADIFSVVMKDEKEVNCKTPKKKTIKRKTKVRRSRPLFNRPEPRTQLGQSILYTDNIEELISLMEKYPMELSLWSKFFPEYKIASTNIAWSITFIDYLKNIFMYKVPQPVSVSVKSEYNIFDEVTSRRMAVIKLDIKLSYLSNTMRRHLKLLSDEKTNAHVYSGNIEPNTVLSVVPEALINLPEETGTIKTIYSRGKKKYSDSKKKTVLKKYIQNTSIAEKKITTDVIDPVEEIKEQKKVNVSLVSLVKSATYIDKSTRIDLIKSKSCSSMNKDYLNILNYIFSDDIGPYYNQTYCVGYFTVENDTNKSSKSSPKSGSQPVVSNTESEKYVRISGKSSTEEKIKLMLCDKDCRDKESSSCNLSVCSLDVPNNTELVKCKQVTCERKTFRKLPTPPDDRILLDLSHLDGECCTEKSEGEAIKKEGTERTDNKRQTVQKVEEVVGGVQAKLKFRKNPCYCECECRFGFMKKTTYCKVCGGFEALGDDLTEKRQYEMPVPCPVYHKLIDKAKTKPSASGSDTRKLTKKKSASGKSVESEKDTKEGKKKKKDDKFKFNYGYTAPHIGHSRCAIPCTGTLNQVPKTMGWLWTADNIPGMKFRPLWKPGAVNKHVLRLLKIAKNPGEAFAKKKRKKDAGKTKRPLKRPLLIVHKKDGEFTVTMETMKSYSKPRTINQVPYEDKDALTYTIGRTDEENRERRKRKERAQRRLERCQRKFIQSAFQDVCEEICLKTYQQALGVLPDAEKPDCTCYPAEPGLDRADFDYSCSCSEDSKLVSSDTDSDEWIVEFTPPTAKFDQSYKCKKIQYTDSSTQYTYLDYKVKLLDRFGNPVARFFKGPDGREQCSDLGGFWGPDHQWLDINVDGFIAPDGKWAPNIFYGPNGEHVDGESGKFQAMDGTWLVIGIDGYIDSQNKWRFYAKAKGKTSPKKRSLPLVAKQGAGDRKEVKLSGKISEGTWSCFGDASPKHLSKMGIMGHGHDRKLLLDTLKKLIAQGEDVKLPEPSVVPWSKSKKSKGNRLEVPRNLYNYESQQKCRHATPSDKGIVAVDARGNKTYFRLKDYKNKRYTDRIATLTDQGISVSSFHVPCFHSFISSELMKRQQYDRLVALSKANQQSTKTRSRLSPA